MAIRLVLFCYHFGIVVTSFFRAEGFNSGRLSVDLMMDEETELNEHVMPVEQNIVESEHELELHTCRKLSHQVSQYFIF